MNNKQTRQKFLDVFREEWKMFVKDHPASGTSGQVLPPHGANFDLPVKAGEVRLFADYSRPFVGLAYKKWGGNDWIVVPVSDFSVPATEAEILIGKRVYQLWNSFTMNDEFVSRSWLVELIPMEDHRDIGEALVCSMTERALREDLRACTGLPIRALSDERLDYERQFGVRLDFAQVAAGQALDFKGDSFWRDYFKKPNVLPAYALAAATAALEECSPLLVLEGVPNTQKDFKRTCFDFDLITGFQSIQPGGEPYTLVFAVKEKDRGPFLGLMRDVAEPEILARNRDTGELIGHGSLDQKTGEIAILTTADVKAPVEAVGEIVLIISFAQKGDKE